VQQPICLLTGATDGVGKVTALELARRGFAVIFAARNAAKAEQVKSEILATVGNAKVDYLIADLKSMRQIRQLARTFAERYPRLDVLINNAGIFSPLREITEDGFESTFQVNYLSQFLLTHLLLDQLGKSTQGRIINLSSSVYTMGQLDLDNLQGERRYSVMRAYSASKLLVLLFTLELAERLRGTPITANAVHPGVVRTQMMFQAPGLFRLISYAALPFAASPRQGAATSLYLASSPQVTEVSGEYFTRCKPMRIKSRFNTTANRALLWNLSHKLALTAHAVAE